jgi:hypothetical protein
MSTAGRAQRTPGTIDADARAAQRHCARKAVIRLFRQASTAKHALELNEFSLNNTQAFDLV